MSFYLLVSFVIILLFVNIKCDNNTERYFKMDSRKTFETRQHRLLTFNTHENGDINVELAFNVPFISIPIKKSIDMAKGAVANVNLGAIILAGAMAFGVAVLIPGIILFFSKKFPLNYPGELHKAEYRNEYTGSSNLWHYLSVLDESLTDNNIDTKLCIQRIICWMVKNSSKNVINGNASTNDKIIDGLANNEWLLQFISDTAIYTALKNGLNGVNCSQKYSQCKITKNSLQNLTKQFVQSINTYK